MFNLRRLGCCAGTPLKSIVSKIWNLRAFEHVDVPFNDYACLGGERSRQVDRPLCAVFARVRRLLWTVHEIRTLLAEEKLPLENKSFPVSSEQGLSIL